MGKIRWKMVEMCVDLHCSSFVSVIMSSLGKSVSPNLLINWK